MIKKLKKRVINDIQVDEEAADGSKQTFKVDVIFIFFTHFSRWLIWHFVEYFNSFSFSITFFSHKSSLVFHITNYYLQYSHWEHYY